MLRHARLFAPSVFLLFGSFVFGLGASSNGRSISFSSSTREAAPLAAPFALMIFGAASSVGLCAASLADAAEKLSRSRSRLS